MDRYTNSCQTEKNFEIGRRFTRASIFSSPIYRGQTALRYNTKRKGTYLSYQLRWQPIMRVNELCTGASRKIYTAWPEIFFLTSLTAIIISSRHSIEEVKEQLYPVCPHACKSTNYCTLPPSLWDVRVRHIISHPWIQRLILVLSLRSSQGNSEKGSLRMWPTMRG